MKKVEIEEVARRIKGAYYFLSMEELIEALGIELRFAPPESTVLDGSPACYYKIKGHPIIYLSYDCPEPLQAKVLAHELGHAILHDVEMAHYGFLFKGRRLEEEADYFAELLLNIGA